MEPAPWRKKEQLTLRSLATKLGCARMTVSRYESGEREAPNSIVIAYGKLSRGEVTAEDLNRVRKRFVAAVEARAQERSTTARAV